MEVTTANNHKDSYPTTQPFSSLFTPAPQSSTTQQNTSNVVVTQPLHRQPETVTTVPDDHLILTLTMMVICCLICNSVAFIFLIPALILSLSASCAINTGNNDRAQKYAKMACFCNVCGAAAIFILIAIAVFGGVTLASMIHS